MSQSRSQPFFQPFWRRRRLWLILWLIAWPALLALLLLPARFGSFSALRLGLVLALLGLWGGALALFWHLKSVRWTGGTLAAIVAVALLGPGRAADAGALRQAYVAALGRYEGAPFVWGGESRSGVDCSGLVRRGLIDADVRQGLATANPALVRQGVALWWHDCSARALKEEYRGQTRLLQTAPSLNRLDHAALLPGDFAVTADGVHTLAYLGNRTWIEADPGPLDRVLRVQVPTDNSWFRRPVSLMRWRQFETG